MAQKTIVMDSFAFERQMVPSVVEWLRSQRLAVKREFSVPWGICDLVGVKLDPKRVRKRLSYGQKRAVGPPLRLHILSRIPDVNSGTLITLKHLGQALFGYLPDDVLEKELEHLVRSKFVKRFGQGQFQKCNGWFPLHRRIVAVELKLARISEALSQASSNRAFATESYVALPWVLAHRVAMSIRSDAFKANGVGILGVSKSSCQRILASTVVKDTPDEVLQAHCVERFWRTRDTPS